MSTSEIETRRQRALEFFSIDQASNNGDAFKLIGDVRIASDDIAKLAMTMEALAEVMVNAAEKSIEQATQVRLTQDILTAGAETLPGLWRNEVEELAKAIFAAAGFEVVE